MRFGSESLIKGQGRRVFLLLTWISTTCARNIVSTNTRERRRALGIDWSPAPPPEDGPPLSAGALRDKSLLPVEIGAIVGAYLFSLCVVGLALILISRKLRRRLELAISTKSADVEMIQPQPKPSAIYPSPISPCSPRNFSYPSPVKTEQNPYVFPNSNISPITPPGTDIFVDHRIVEADRDMAQQDLEDIYAHVMAQEEAKAAGLNPKEMPPPAPIPTLGPQRQNSPKKNEKARPANINIDDNKSTKSRASSIMSILKSPRKKSVRSMQISSPMLTPASATFPRDNTASDEEPLSPRYYKPPPPPPVPANQVRYAHSRDTSNITPTSPTRSIAEQLAPYGPGSQQHRPNPSQNSFQSVQEDPASATSTNSQTPLYPTRKQSPHPNPTGSNPTASNNGSTRTLPFRQFEPSLKSPSFRPATKTTVLERKPASNTGPLTGGLKTPWSAGAVPYSPYQPFTPMMPITPRLVTKEDRKAMKKAEKRAPVTEMVRSDDEIWDDGY
ncbi:Uncharacterized protein BP5553_01709 [Venustampulla echinocandica]|uniref:Uncharacterized protein n=1 Tax=Venustampulla echinocandica TaxID=2656787 RepID=A0A370U1S2_9HELO|nr:Uncharacterized protein BP5553_01709 [Venustampulla echinocandica]RDL41730.1 Uncharacterized protein BP5553_01709 [Venustampulla echinocandica]